MIIPILILAAISMALMDAIAHDKIISFFKYRDFWNINFSWRGKYKDGDPSKGARFFGSTTFFVAFTDGWHVAKWIFLKCVCFVVAYLWVDGFWNVLIHFLSVSIGFGIVFEGAYRLWCGEKLIKFKNK